MNNKRFEFLFFLLFFFFFFGSYFTTGFDNFTPDHRKKLCNTMDNRNKFGLLDILRIVSGLLLINALLSWHFTSTSTWGYDGKYVNLRYLNHLVRSKPVNFTMEELAKYDGTDRALPIYLAINGSVYDVSASPQIYGPQGPYRFFSGRDAARAFVTGCFHKKDEFTYDLRGLNSLEAEKDLRAWQDFFANSGKYFFVGTVEHPPLTEDPPELCSGAKYPHH